MLEKIYGSTKKQTIVRRIIDALDGGTLSGTLYIGYPIVASADESITIDALLVSPDHGLTAFVLFESANGPLTFDADFWRSVEDAQDRLYFAIEANLKRHQSLRQGRELGVPINVVTVFPSQADSAPPSEQIRIATPETLQALVVSQGPIPAEFVKPLNAALQRVTTIKPAKKRASVSRTNSRGGILKAIEREIANLDRWQKQAAIESPEGPQRIRGLAGSGKTVVLALKAAYLHAQNPDWEIVITFHTRSLYQQFKDFVRRFCFEHLGDEPDWSKLRIIHAWGSGGRSGVYSEIAEKTGFPVRDFIYGKTKYGRERAFHGICEELLLASASLNVEPFYDAVLIDEAQDLPAPFFRLVHRFTREPKRIVWAYDELQKLAESAVPPIEELFGKTPDGNPVVSLETSPGQARRDVVLPVCYRNTPWALTLAHALGLGIYREGGLVQHFDDPALWLEIGYNLLSGNLALGEDVLLERRPDSYPSYFLSLLNSEDAVSAHIFSSDIEQAEWIAENIRKNVSEDELDRGDIMIILPNPITAQKNAVPIMDALSKRSIRAHVVGVTASQDEVFTEDSVAISQIFRAKGNEASMVYVANADYCFKGYELIKLRNSLFTAITRSRAWVRICGMGENMTLLKKEIDAVKREQFRLKFRIPTEEQLMKLRKIHRERTRGEQDRIKKAEKGIREFLTALQNGDITLEQLPPSIRAGLREHLAAVSTDDELGE